MTRNLFHKKKRFWQNVFRGFGEKRGQISWHTEKERVSMRWQIKTFQLIISQEGFDWNFVEFDEKAVPFIFLQQLRWREWIYRRRRGRRRTVGWPTVTQLLYCSLGQHNTIDIIPERWLRGRWLQYGANFPVVADNIARKLGVPISTRARGLKMFTNRWLQNWRTKTADSCFDTQRTLNLTCRSKMKVGGKD